jgi:hypothetical protein
MAKAKAKFIAKPDWDLSDLHRYLCVELDYEIDPAVREIENAIKASRLELMVQIVVQLVQIFVQPGPFFQPGPGPWMPQGDPVKVDPYDFRIDYALEFEPHNKTVKVVCEKLDREWARSTFGGGTFPGFVQRYYTISEAAARQLWPSRLPASQAAAKQQTEDRADLDSYKPTSTKAWVVAEVAGMKKAGEIPKGIIKTDFAQLLEKQMGKAAKTNKSLRPVKRDHILNNLSRWGLWPIESIKIS